MTLQDAVLFCPTCEALLFERARSGLLSACPVCGWQARLPAAPPLQAAWPESLPPDVALQAVISPDGNHAWLAGLSAGRSVLHVSAFGSPALRLESWPTPSKWQLNGLALAGDVLLLSPDAGPGGSKALAGVDAYSGQERWRVSSGGFMFTCPAAQGDLACAVDSHGLLLAVNPHSGKQAWPDLPQLGDYPHNHLGPVLTPELVLVVGPSHLGAALLGFERSSGRLRFSARPDSGARISCEPVVVGERAYVYAGSWLYAFDLQQQTWQPLYQAPFRSPRGWFVGTPVCSVGLLLALTGERQEDGGGYALLALSAATGELLWRRRFDRRPHRTPLLEGAVIYASDREGSLLAWDALTGDERQVLLKLTAEPLLGPLRVADGLLLAGRDGSLLVVPAPALQPAPPEPGLVYEQRGLSQPAAVRYLLDGREADALRVVQHSQSPQRFERLQALLAGAPPPEPVAALPPAEPLTLEQQILNILADLRQQMRAGVTVNNYGTLQGLVIGDSNQLEQNYAPPTPAEAPPQAPAAPSAHAPAGEDGSKG